MNITFLGTAGGIIAANRSCPSILIGKNILLDCGEGTTQKLIQVNSIDSIKTICLSHLHGDHFMGISSLLWYFMITGRREELTLIGPSPLKGTITKILELTNIPEALKSLPFKLRFIELTKSDGVVEVDNEFKINYAEMVHPVKTFAYRIEINGEIICYSGDTSPNQNLINLADNCDLFICESTFSDDQTQLANQYGHCTPSDAARIAKDAECKKLVLVHISPYFEEIIKNSIESIKKIYNKEILIAEDLMTLNTVKIE
ncbi:MAG: MBL fold metallo-hydrolase [Promethearchaeota archaeon]